MVLASILTSLAPGVVLDVAAGLGVMAAGAAYAITQISAGKKKANLEVHSEADKETEKLVAMLKEQIELLATKVEDQNQVITDMGTKLEEVSKLLLELACLNAPTCDNRNCPNRYVIGLGHA